MEVSDIVTPPTLRNFLSYCGFNLDDGADRRFRVVRHAGQNGTPERLYSKGIELLDGYQSYQDRQEFRNADFLVSFIATAGDECKFVGIYQVLGCFTKGSEEYIDPAKFGVDVASTCLGSEYFYATVRDKGFDPLRGRFTIRWGKPASGWAPILANDDKDIVSYLNSSGERRVPLSLEDIIGDVGPEIFDDLAGESPSFNEGQQHLRTHLARERSKTAVRLAKQRFKAQNGGRVFCEACGFDFTVHYGSRGEGYIECHHALPVSQLEPGSKTRIEDLVLLCANCHRMAHNGVSLLTLTELRSLVLAVGR
jgi:hypothetical protein